MKRLALCLIALTALSPAQNNQSKTIPPFTGTWTLDLRRTTFVGKAHPPIAAEVVIRYDGTHWHRWRSHTAADGKVDKQSMDIIVDSPKPLVKKEGPVTVYSRMTHDGNALVLEENFVADTGEKATNTVRYTLEDSGKTLIEFEQETAQGETETNRWVSTRKK